MLPVIALIGRPNVGKSTLFNRLTRSRDALVADYPGLTRDRQYGFGKLGPAPYLVIDTGGVAGGEVGIHELKELIALAAAELDHVGMLFNRDWRDARDELLEFVEPRISYREFSAVCDRHGLSAWVARTLAILMHDLGYIVYDADDEHLR